MSLKPGRVAPTVPSGWNLRKSALNYLSFSNRAQVILEFTFCIIVVMLMLYGLIMVFRWTGVDSAERRLAHDRRLTSEDINPDYPQDNPGEGPLWQIDPYFYKPIGMNAIWNGEIRY